MRRHKLLAATIALLVALAAGAAYAYFTATGSGTGHGTTGTIQPVTVAAVVGGDTPSSTLLPGGTADVILRVNNPNAFAVKLVSVSGNGTISASGGSGTCTTTGVSFANQTGLNITIAASPPDTLVHLAGAASMSTASQTGCQGATFSIPVSITVHQP